MMRTMFEISIDFVRTNIRSHGNNRGRRALLSYIHAGRDTIELRHDNVHENQVKVLSPHGVHSIISLSTIRLKSVSNLPICGDATTYGMLNFTPHGLEKFDTDLSASGIIFNEENLGLLDPPDGRRLS